MNQHTARLLLLTLTPWLLGGFRWLDREIFQPDQARYADPLAAMAQAPLRSRLQEVYFSTADGVRLNGWYVPAPPGGYTAVFAHGTDGNLGNYGDIVEAFVDEGYGILAYDYRGYGKSQGNTCESGLYQDMQAASRYLAQERNTPLSEQIAVGQSLGSGVVVDAAARLPYRATVLFAAFTSIPEVAAHVRDTRGLHLLRIFPMRHLFGQQFDSFSKISEVTSPLLIMHGQQDKLMPVSMPQALFERAASPDKTLLLIPGAAHDTTFSMGRRPFFEALEALLKTSRRLGTRP